MRSLSWQIGRFENEFGLLTRGLAAAKAEKNGDRGRKPEFAPNVSEDSTYPPQNEPAVSVLSFRIAGTILPDLTDSTVSDE